VIALRIWITVHAVTLTSQLAGKAAVDERRLAIPCRRWVLVREFTRRID